MKFSLVVLALVMFMIVTAHASPRNPPANLWKGILAEASSERSEGMIAVAWVYKNRLDRGMKLGCSGLHRKNLNQWIAKEGARNEKMAKKILNEVFSEKIKDPTHGATHYENVSAFGLPSWAKGMTITTKIGRHTFFKENKNG